MTEQTIVSLLKTETILQFLLVISFVGFGTWFARAGWPWLTKYFEKRQDFQFELEERRIEAEAEADRRWQETMARMTDTFANLKEELGAFRATQHAFTSILEQVFRFWVKNGDHSDR